MEESEKIMKCKKCGWEMREVGDCLYEGYLCKKCYNGKDWLPLVGIVSEKNFWMLNTIPEQTLTKKQLKIFENGKETDPSMWLSRCFGSCSVNDSAPYTHKIVEEKEK